MQNCGLIWLSVSKQKAYLVSQELADEQCINCWQNGWPVSQSSQKLPNGIPMVQTCQKQMVNTTRQNSRVVWVQLGQYNVCWCPGYFCHGNNENDAVILTNDDYDPFWPILQSQGKLLLTHCDLQMAIWHHRTRPTLVNVMAFHLLSTKQSKPSPKPMLLYWKSLGTNLREIWIKIETFSFKKIHWKMSPAKWQSFCSGLNILMQKMCNSIVSALELHAFCINPGKW